MSDPLSFTEAAARRVHELITLEGKENLKLRVYITGGGCSGFQYGFKFEEQTHDNDCVISKDILLEETDEDDSEGSGSIRVQMVVDALSLMYLTGAEVDYVENLQGAHFTVKNPNAQTSCSCGSSFAI